MRGSPDFIGERAEWHLRPSIQGGGNAFGCLSSLKSSGYITPMIRPILTELAGKSARAIAAELNERKVPTPNGGPWYAATVIRVQRRLDD